MVRKNLTQQQLSLLSGVTAPSISMYCTGARLPRAAELCRLATALQVSMDYLWGIDDNSYENSENAATEIAALKAKLMMITSALQAVLDQAKD